MTDVECSETRAREAASYPLIAAAAANMRTVEVLVNGWIVQIQHSDTMGCGFGFCYRNGGNGSEPGLPPDTTRHDTLCAAEGETRRRGEPCRFIPRSQGRHSDNVTA